jgi:hypothetical protein
MPRIVIETGRYATLVHQGQTVTLFIRHVWFGKPDPKQSSDWYVAVWDKTNYSYRDILISELYPVDHAGHHERTDPRALAP